MDPEAPPKQRMSRVEDGDLFRIEVNTSRGGCIERCCPTIVAHRAIPYWRIGNFYAPDRVSTSFRKTVPHLTLRRGLGHRSGDAATFEQGRQSAQLYLTPVVW